MTQICRVPECNARLYPKNTSGLCRKHNHYEGLCDCFQCTGYAPPPKPADIKSVDVAYPTSNSGVPGLAKVSLPRAPWDEPPP